MRSNFSEVFKQMEQPMANRMKGIWVKFVDCKESVSRFSTSLAFWTMKCRTPFGHSYHLTPLPGIVNLSPSFRYSDNNELWWSLLPIKLYSTVVLSNCCWIRGTPRVVIIVWVMLMVMYEKINFKRKINERNFSTKLIKQSSDGKVSLSIKFNIYGGCSLMK